METQTTVETGTMHPFERAGFGKAPFRYVGSFVSKYQACQGAPIQAGSSCDYCANAIMLVFRIRSADGREFKVGCDCVEKVAAAREVTDPRDLASKKLAAAVKTARLKHQRTVKAARDAEKANELTTILADERARETLAALPHPSIPGRSLLEYAEWMAEKAGARGRAKVLKTVAAALGR